MKSKIMVTGGCGYIGSHTVIELIKSGFETVIVDDLSNSSEKSLDRIQEITGVLPHFEKVDLANQEKTMKIFKKHTDVKAVIHFAAHKAVGESVEQPLMYYQNNLFSLINLLSALEKYRIPNFIFSSSATVYGIPTNLPITEDEATQRPFSPYGNTKKVAEEILDDVVKSAANLNAISLRYFNPIGAHESGLIGELPNGIPNNLMPYITQVAVGIREKLMVFGNDYPTKDGTPIRDYIHVVDLAKAHVIAVERLLNQQNEAAFEYFNLGTGKGYSVFEVIRTFEEVTKTKLNYEVTSRRAGDVPQLYAATNLAEKKLKWKAKKGLKEMIASSWKWEQNVRGEG